MGAGKLWQTKKKKKGIKEREIEDPQFVAESKLDCKNAKIWNTYDTGDRGRIVR